MLALRVVLIGLFVLLVLARIIGWNFYVGRSQRAGRSMRERLTGSSHSYVAPTADVRAKRHPQRTAVLTGVATVVGVVIVVRHHPLAAIGVGLVAGLVVYAVDLLVWRPGGLLARRTSDPGMPPSSP